MENSPGADVGREVLAGEGGLPSNMIRRHHVVAGAGGAPMDTDVEPDHGRSAAAITQLLSHAAPANGRLAETRLLYRRMTP